MKKFLFAIAAFAMTLTASAGENTPSKGSIGITEFLTEEVEGEILHEAVVSFDGIEAENWVAFQANVIGSDNVTILDVFTTGDGPFDVKKNRKIVFSTSSVDLEGENGKMFVAFDMAKTGTTIASGDALLIAFEANGDGEIYLDKMMGTNAPEDGDNGFTFDKQTYKVTSTASKAVVADGENNVNKFVENGKVVIVKGAKKYNVGGAQLQ